MEGHQPGHHGRMGGALPATVVLLSFSACWFVPMASESSGSLGKLHGQLEQKLIHQLLVTFVMSVSPQLLLMTGQGFAFFFSL
jgi:hypothetical protein